MPNTFILVDFENVQPKNLAQLANGSYRLKIFVGSQQAKVPFELAQTVQALGERATYVQIAGTGRNALDLHIAYYVGRLAVQNPDASFHIISKDKDYDVLIKHLVSQGIRCRRTGSVEDVVPNRPTPGRAAPKARQRPGVAPTAPQAAAPAPTPAPSIASDRLTPVIAHLRNLKASRPRKVKTLSSTLKARFAKNGGDRDVQALVEELRRRGVIAIEGTNVAYRLD